MRTTSIHSTANKFDPFGDRQAREIRNTMAAALAQSLLKCRSDHYERVFKHWLKLPLASNNREYIRKRMSRYVNVYTNICRGKYKDPFIQAAIIWNDQLYFEVHEVLEFYWSQAEGRYRKALQSLIKAAGAFIHWEHGNFQAARRLGIKAATLIRQHSQELAAVTNVKALADLLQKGELNTFKLHLQ